MGVCGLDFGVFSFIGNVIGPAVFAFVVFSLSRPVGVLYAAGGSH